MASDQECGMAGRIQKAQNGNVQELDALLNMHQGLIALLAGRLYCKYISREELIQAGNLGFMLALERYDAAHHTKLTTYAVPWILGEMRRALRMTENSICSLDKESDHNEQTLYDILAGDEGTNIRYMDLRFALEKLSREEKCVISMRYYQDKTQRESAVLMGKSQAQISKIERHALDTLHELLS